MKILKGASLVVSWVFHPLLILTYVLIMMIAANPYPFGVPRWTDHSGLIGQVFAYTFFLPAFAVVLFRLVGFSKTLGMSDSKERVGPYIASGIVYMWMFTTLQHHPLLPPLYKVFMLGATISLFLAFFINNFSKISAHTTGMGGFLGMWLVVMTQGYGDALLVRVPLTSALVNLNMEAILMLVVLCAGLVGSARLFLKAHEPKEVYGGYLVGFAGQLIAQQFIHFFV